MFEYGIYRKGVLVAKVATEDEALQYCYNSGLYPEDIQYRQIPVERYEVVSETEGVLDTFDTQFDAVCFRDDVLAEQYNTPCFSAFDCPSISVRKVVY